MESTTPTITLSKKDIESLQQAARFRHQGEDRENLTGVYLDKDGFAIGTDGHHLVVRSIPTLTSLDSNLLINPTSLIEVHEAATLSVHMDEVQLQTTTDKLALSISEQQFPDYHSILPEDQPTVCSLNKNDLLVMLGSANEALASQPDTSRTVMLTLDLEQEKFSLDSNHITSPDSHSSFHSSVAISQPNNRLGILKVAVNLDLLLDCITAVDGDLVVVKGTAWNKPLDIVGEQHRAVLMPIKL